MGIFGGTVSTWRVEELQPTAGSSWLSSVSQLLAAGLAPSPGPHSASAGRHEPPASLRIRAAAVPVDGHCRRLCRLRMLPRRSRSHAARAGDCGTEDRSNDCQARAADRPMEAPCELVGGHCFDSMAHRSASSVHAVVTDPPWGLKEYTAEEKTRQRRGRVRRRLVAYGVRCRDSPCRATRRSGGLPSSFGSGGGGALRVLGPGGHVFLATNPLLSRRVYAALEQCGFEKRGEIIRLVQTLRGGDCPRTPTTSSRTRQRCRAPAGRPGARSASTGRAGCKTICAHGRPEDSAGSALPRRDSQRSYALLRTRDRHASLPEAPGVHAPNRVCRIAAGRRVVPDSFVSSIDIGVGDLPLKPQGTCSGIAGATSACIVSRPQSMNTTFVV